MALLLLSLLAAAGVVALGPLRDSADFDEGLYRFQAMLRMARAEAAGSGLRLQLAPQETEEGFCIRILVEADPLGEPGRFAPHTGCTWRSLCPDGLVRVTRCRVVGEDAYRRQALAERGDEKADGPTLEPVTFNTDGSSDSAIFELAPIDEGDSRRAVVRLDGLNCTVFSKMLVEAELEEYYEQIGLEDQWDTGK